MEDLPRLVLSKLESVYHYERTHVNSEKRLPEQAEIPSELATCLGVRRTMTLRRIMRQSGLPLEVVLDLALETARHREPKARAYRQ